MPNKVPDEASLAAELALHPRLELPVVPARHDEDFVAVAGVALLFRPRAEAFECAAAVVDQGNDHREVDRAGGLHAGPLWHAPSLGLQPFLEPIRGLSPQISQRCTTNDRSPAIEVGLDQASLRKSPGGSECTN